MKRDRCGQGSLGRATVEKIKAFFEIDGNYRIRHKLFGHLQHMKGGAHAGATGENSIKVMSRQVDVIIGLWNFNCEFDDGNHLKWRKLLQQQC